MGNSSGGTSGLQAAVTRAEQRNGALAITGRYHRTPRKLEDDYVREDEVLGSGYNGEVFLATSKATKQRYAVKAFNLVGVSKEMMEDLVSEAEIFLSMDHPHVARLSDVYETTQELSLVMECMEGGELFERLLKRKVFSEAAARAAVWQMLLALNYIHQHNIVHRDIKLDNFLYESDASDHLKLIDFGFSKIRERHTKLDENCGTLAYIAPEVLDKNYNEKCDLWSLGVISFILLSGSMPFNGTDSEQRQNILRGNYTLEQTKWSKVSEGAADFVKALLQVDSKRRLSAEEALEHPWVKIQDEEQEAKNMAAMPVRASSLDNEMVESLCQFAQASQFKKAALQVTAWSLTNEERAKVREAFLEIDKSKSGTIKLCELKQALTDQFHLTDEQILPMFEAMDSSHDEEVRYTDFLAAMCASRIPVHDQLLHETFRRFDVDNSGFITIDNMREVLRESVPEHEIEAALQDADKAGNGKIDYQEFIDYLKNPDAHRTYHAHDEVVRKMEAEARAAAMQPRPRSWQRSVVSADGEDPFCLTRGQQDKELCTDKCVSGDLCVLM